MYIKTLATGSSGNLYILYTNSYNYLIECGIDKHNIIKTLYENGELISSFSGCFISHRHADHNQSAKVINKYMPIYSNWDVFSKGLYRGSVLKANEKFYLNDLTVIPFNVEHGEAENYAYIFKADNEIILFATDFSKFEPDLKSIPFDELYIECNWTQRLMEKMLETADKDYLVKLQRQYNTHCSLDILKETLDKTINLNNCKIIHLIHNSKECCEKDIALNDLQQTYPNIKIVFAEDEIGKETI